jgi:hypothetical protein
MDVQARFTISRTSGDGVPAGTLTVRLTADRTGREIAAGDIDYGQLGAVVTGGEALLTLTIPDEVDLKHLNQRLETLEIPVPREIYSDVPEGPVDFSFINQRITEWVRGAGYHALPQDWQASRIERFSIRNTKGRLDSQGRLPRVVRYTRWVDA